MSQFPIKIYSEEKRKSELKRVKEQKDGNYPDYLRSLYNYFVDKSFENGEPGKWCYPDFGEMVEAVYGFDYYSKNDQVKKYLRVLARMDYIDYLCVNFDDVKKLNHKKKYRVTIHKELDF